MPHTENQFVSTYVTVTIQKRGERYKLVWFTNEESWDSSSVCLAWLNDVIGVHLINGESDLIFGLFSRTVEVIVFR